MISRNKALRRSAYGTALALCAGLAGPALATDETNWRQEMDILLQNTGSLVAFDGAGNVFLARAVGTVGNDDVWFAKYDAGGTELWSRRLASSKIDRPLGIATDTHGNLYLAGVTEGALFGANRGDLDAWVAEFDCSGKRIWGRQFGTTEADVAMSVAVGADADVHLAGTTWGPLAGVRQPRGAAWAIYGFALSYGYTRDTKYLDASAQLAKKFISHLDDAVIPWNDFHEAPHPGRVRDASAGAIAVCGFQELDKHGAADAEIQKAKHALLARLCSQEYLDFNDACCGVQKRGQGGRNGYTSWGDYFLMEAVSRELKGEEMFW